MIGSPALFASVRRLLLEKIIPALTDHTESCLEAQAKKLDTKLKKLGAATSSSTSAPAVDVVAGENGGVASTTAATDIITDTTTTKEGGTTRTLLNV